jgi:hypothetical protein
MSRKNRMRHQQRRAAPALTDAGQVEDEQIDDGLALEERQAGDNEHQAADTEHQVGEEQAEDPYAKLQREYAELKTTRDLEARQLADERARREQLEAAHGRAEQDVRQSHQAVIEQAITAFTLEAEQATAAIETAFAAGDGRALAAAQRKLVAAEHKLQRLQDGKEALAAQESEKTQREAAQSQRRAAQSQQQSFEAEISRFSEPSKAWLRENPDVVTDQALQRKAIAAHNLAVLRNIAPDTDEYFDFLEETLWPESFQEAPPARQEAPPARGSTVGQQRQAPGRRYSAPPSRNAGNGRNRGGEEVTLTATQREYARAFNMTDREYGDFLREAKERKLIKN